MRSSILIVSYLWKDTWSRWREQPSSFLARWFVAGLLSLAAILIVAAFILLERSIRARMESFGLNCLVTREMVSGTDPEFVPVTPATDRLQPLARQGEKIRLRQLFLHADTELQPGVTVLTYPQAAVGSLLNWLLPETGFVYITDKYPELLRVKFALGRETGAAIVRHPGNFWRPLGLDEFLLIPEGWAPATERLGYIDTMLFRARPDAAPIERQTEAINLLYALDHRNPPQIQTALPLLKEFQELKEKEKEWRAFLAGLLGVMLALVFGAIAVLELRQNLFVAALLRSLGAPARYLFFRQWLENCAIANGAALAALALAAIFHSVIFSKAGFSKEVISWAEGNPYLAPEMLMIFVWVNIGAFLSAIPVAFGLRQPVGLTLN